MAVLGADEENRKGCSPAPSEGKVRTVMRDAESACKSCWEVEGTGAGATGAAGTFRAAQHGKLQQCPPLQHVFAAGEGPYAATIGYAARTNPSRNATAILVTFETMPLACSLLIRKPCRRSRIGAPKSILNRRVQQFMGHDTIRAAEAWFAVRRKTPGANPGIRPRAPRR